MNIQIDKDVKDEKVEEIIQKIISYRGNNGRLMLESYNIEFINNYLSRNLTQIEVIFQQYKNKKGIDIIDFLYQMLNQMDYNSNETLYITVALIDFFQAIIENENLTQLIKFQNITNFICENDPTFAEGTAKFQSYLIFNLQMIYQMRNTFHIVYLKMLDHIEQNNFQNYYEYCFILKLFISFEQNSINISIINNLKQLLFNKIKPGVVSDRKIPTKKLPEEKKFDINRVQRIVREIDINPPILFKDDDTLIRRLTKDKNCIDSIHHNMNMIVASQYINTLDRIITLDSYSDHFLFYNSDCIVTKEIHPQLQQVLKLNHQ